MNPFTINCGLLPMSTSHFAPVSFRADMWRSIGCSCMFSWSRSLMSCPIKLLNLLLWVPHLKLFLDVFLSWFVNSNVHELETISSIWWQMASADVVGIRETDDGLCDLPLYVWWQELACQHSIYCSMVSCVDQWLGEIVMCHPYRKANWGW